jgi:hypothetical protein
LTPEAAPDEASGILVAGGCYTRVASLTRGFVRTTNHPDWGAAWRQRDFDFFTGETFRRLLRENNVKLVTWREIGRLIGRAR